MCVALAAAVLLLQADPAGAQATLTVDAGLGGYYRGAHWLPVHVRLTNAGPPARVTVEARMASGQPNSLNSVLPEQTLPEVANSRHTLYLRPRWAYSTVPITVEMRQPGRATIESAPSSEMVQPGDWLVLGIGAGGEALKTLTTLRMKTDAARVPVGGTTRWISVKVATEAPDDIPDRWQGLTAADLVVLGQVGEREFAPERMTAIRQYVEAGGSLVVVGGADHERLNTPFFQSLLPGRLQDSAVAHGLPRGFPGAAERNAGRSISYCVLEPSAGAEVLVPGENGPWLVRRRLGAGQVWFIPFDVLGPAWSNWSGATALWRWLLARRAGAVMVNALGVQEDAAESWRYGPGAAGWNPMDSHLAVAPYAISLMDVPSFYLVAGFLLAYVIILVPVNYLVLKAIDRRELAWLTTPVIVAAFSFGAYAIGFGTRGGRSVLVRAGVIETHAGQPTGRYLSYLGLFSPRKARYRIAPAEPAAGGSGGATLLSLPATDREGAAPVLRHASEVEVDGLAIDMWAMRVVRQDTLVPLGNGFSAELRSAGARWSGTIVNSSPLDLKDAAVVSDGRAALLGDLKAGKSLSLQNVAPTIEGAGLLPSALADRLQGTSDDLRVRRAVFGPISQLAGSLVQRTQGEVALVGWVQSPVGAITIDGSTPRETAANLLVVHLGKAGG